MEEDRFLPVIEKLVRNGRKRYGWRYLEHGPALCLVGLYFTVAPDKGDDKATFERKMFAFAIGLGRRGYPVVRLQIEQRAGGRPWASFETRTPQYFLRRARRGRPAGGGMHSEF